MTTRRPDGNGASTSAACSPSSFEKVFSPCFKGRGYMRFVNKLERKENKTGRSEWMRGVRVHVFLR